MKENDFYKLLNGTWFKSTLSTGEVIYSRSVRNFKNLVNAERVDNLCPISLLCNLASELGAETNLILRNGEIVGGFFTLCGDCVVKCILNEKDELCCYADSVHLAHRLCMDLLKIDEYADTLRALKDIIVSVA